MKKILKIAGIALLTLIATPLVIGQIMKLIASDVPPPGELYDVGGYRLHINCMDSSESNGALPTVVIEAGAGTPSPVYHWLLQGISETTKVCVYDRAGLAWSEESGLPRDSQTIATALHVLLEKAGLQPPFVFAGHSIAGLYMRQYVEQYPDDVAGLVFLDPSHPDQTSAFRLSEEDQAKQQATAEQQIAIFKLMVRLGFTEIYNPLTELSQDHALLPEDIQAQSAYVTTLPRHLEALPREGMEFEEAAIQAAENTSLGDRPVVVFSATEPIPAGVLPEEFPENLTEIFANLHKEIAALSTIGRHVEIDTANHMSLVANKEQVAKTLPYIRDVILQAAAPQRE